MLISKEVAEGVEARWGGQGEDREWEGQWVAPGGVAIASHVLERLCEWQQVQRSPLLTTGQMHQL